MIDEKKIEEAQDEIFEDKFLLNGEEIEFDNDAKEEMFYKEDIKEAIKLGANWAIEQFLKDLWHPAEETPKTNIFIPCFIQLQSDYEGRRFKACDYHKNIGFSSSKGWIDEREIIRWCYVNDLFPKKGDNHD